MYESKMFRLAQELSTVSALLPPAVDSTRKGYCLKALITVEITSLNRRHTVCRVLNLRLLATSSSHASAGLRRPDLAVGSTLPVTIDSSR